MTARLVSIIALLAAPVLLSACGAVEDTTADDFSGWQPEPMAPDQRLADKAGIDEACQSRSIFLNATMPPPMALPMHVELQDRRTPKTAAFIVSTVGYVGSCFVSPVQTIAVGNLYELPIPDLTDAISVEGAGSGLLGAGEVSYVWGQAAAGVTGVAIDLGGELHTVDLDDRVVAASIGGGYWLGWWPDSAQPNHIAALDAQGNTLGSVKRTDDGWVAE